MPLGFYLAIQYCYDLDSKLLLSLKCLYHKLFQSNEMSLMVFVRIIIVLF